LQQTEEELTAAKVNKRQWYVNGLGQTFVILDTGEFQMGSPGSEADRNPNEHLHRRNVGRRFAISTKEVTRAQWRVFAKAQQGKVWPADQETLMILMRSDDSPMGGMNWYEAAWYCNWLSEQEGIPKDQWCYEPNDKGEYGSGMKGREKFWELSGYRLPTEAEWEFACRAGASTTRYYGLTETLLPNYAWFQVNANAQTWPVASLKPNDFGLFDTQGNVREWIYDPYSSYPSTSKDAAADAPNTDAVSDTGRRVLRGGSLYFVAGGIRSAIRDDDQPVNRTFFISGLRPARTFNVNLQTGVF
jgi:formylglycine-generating enzyme required for sulfatase activity